MVFELTILNILVLFGAFQGFILALVLVSTERLRRPSNNYLALLLFSFALLNLVSVIELSPGEKADWMHYHPFFWVNTIPVAAYFFVKYLIEPEYSFRKIDFLFFLPFVMELIARIAVFFTFLISGPFSKETFYQRVMFLNTVELIAGIYSLVVLIYAIKALKVYEQKLYEHFSNVEDRSLAWLKNTLIIGLALALLWLVVTMTDYSQETFSLNLALVTLIGLTVLIGWVGYSMIIRQDLLVTSIFAVSDKSEELDESTELSSKTDEYYSQLIRLMNDEKIYQNPQLSMSILAERLTLSNSYLSQIINQKEGKNFFDFVNHYRIEEVKEKIKDPNYEHFSILGIAQEVGFKSKSTFNAVFKKKTGMTPSAFRKS